MRKYRDVALGFAALLCGGGEAWAQQAPFYPGDMQNRQVVLSGSTVEALNIQSENGVIAAGILANAVVGGLTATGTNQATAYNTTTSPGGGLSVFSTVAGGTGVGLSGNIPYCALSPVMVAATVCIGGTQGISNAGANDLTVYPPVGGTATIDGGAAGGGVVLAPNSTCYFQRTAAAAWVSIGCSLTQLVYGSAQVTWRTTDTVTAGTAPAILYFPWTTGAIDSVWAIDAAGTYTAAVQIGSTAVTGCGAIAVSTTGALSTCTAANTLVKGNAVSVVVSSPSGSPDGGGLSIQFHHSALVN